MATAQASWRHLRSKEGSGGATTACRNLEAKNNSFKKDVNLGLKFRCERHCMKMHEENIF